MLLLLAPRVTLDVGVLDKDALKDDTLVDEAVMIVKNRDGVFAGLAELVGVAVADAVGVHVGDGETESVGDPVKDDVGVWVKLAPIVILAVGVLVIEADSVLDDVAELDAVSVEAELSDALALADELLVAVRVAAEVNVKDGSPVCDAVPIEVEESAALLVEEGGGDNDRVAVGKADAVTVDDSTAYPVDVAEGAAVGDAGTDAEALDEEVDAEVAEFVLVALELEAEVAEDVLQVVAVEDAETPLEPLVELDGDAAAVVVDVVDDVMDHDGASDAEAREAEGEMVRVGRNDGDANADADPDDVGTMHETTETAPLPPAPVYAPAFTNETGPVERTIEVFTKDPPPPLRTGAQCSRMHRLPLTACRPPPTPVEI